MVMVLSVKIGRHCNLRTTRNWEGSFDQCLKKPIIAFHTKGFKNSRKVEILNMNKTWHVLQTDTLLKSGSVFWRKIKIR